ncbi:MAG: tRNA (N6-threonylcarbamoyladenosine(37)-N6)-methyltransferase TrmO [bacterium]|nr:tRNA (N6-threonylcarbamoyladenosine(37)-N6)-methyltransferase TrmO [bacterium]MDD5756750.1 tRNA (N6-threonylcarbamoyladenosine(37)-N6)-methyltransferase TrmO [bacterium]
MTGVITLKPIGVIHTPYKKPAGIPIQGKFDQGVRGKIRLIPKYTAGLKDIAGFSHLILIYYFNRSKEEQLVGTPFLENNKHGIFAIRSPHRPNHLGFSIVKLEKVQGSNIIFSEVDILDGTPLLDIKPYVQYFDSRNHVKSGWIKKHFKDNKIPVKTRLR